jgi:hypothetical protein
MILSALLRLILSPIASFHHWRRGRALRPCDHKWGPAEGHPRLSAYWIRRCKRKGCDAFQTQTEDFEWIDAGRLSVEVMRLMGRRRLAG